MSSTPDYYLFIFSSFKADDSLRSSNIKELCLLIIECGLFLGDNAISNKFLSLTFYGIESQLLNKITLFEALYLSSYINYFDLI